MPSTQVNPPIGGLAQGVGQQHLFGHAKGKGHQTFGKVLPLKKLVFPAAKLGDDFGVQGDGAAHDIGEKAKGAGIIQWSKQRSLSTETIHQVGNLLESEEAESQGGDQSEQRQMQSGEGVESLQEKIKVLK